MTNVAFSDQELVINVQGLDKLLAFKNKLTLPLRHIRKVERNPEPLMAPRYSFFGLGTIFAGRIQTGTFREQGETSFWDVRDPRKAIRITLADHRYAKVIVEVENAEEVMGQIQARIARA